MREPPVADRELKLFTVLALLGLLAQLLRVQIPHTEVFLEGRWAFGLIGFAVLRRRWAAFMLAVVLALPLFSSVALWVGFLGNMLYAAPSLLIVRYVHPRLLQRHGPGLIYGLGWFFLVLVLYQALFTPAIWAVIGMIEGQAVGPKIIEGWRTQPYLFESILVALVSAALMVAGLTLQELRRKQVRLDLFNHTLMAVRRINQAILHEEDPRRIGRIATHHLVESGIFRRAWIALRVPDEDFLLTIAEPGPDGLPVTRQVPALPTDLPACVQQSLTTDETVTMSVPQPGCPGCAQPSAGCGGSTRTGERGPTQEVCLSRVLSTGSTGQGALAVSAAAHIGRRDDVRGLFEEVAGDLTFALQRIEAAKQLRDSEEKYRALAMQSADCLFLHDRDGRILDVNPAACRTYGYSREEFLGKSVHDLDPDHDERADGGRFFDRIKSGEPLALEMRQRTRAGRIFPAELRLSLVEVGDRTLVQALCRDITERHETERHLRENEHRFRSFVENANDIVYGLSPEGVFTYVSPNWMDFLGEPAESVIGKPFEPYIHPEDRSRCREFLELVIRTGAKQRGVEYRVRHADGSWRWHVSNGSPIKNADGSVSQYAGISRDVTDSKRAEEERAELHAQLLQAQKMESVGRLAGGVAHDFNNMLNVILGYVDMLLDDVPTDSSLRGELEEIRRAAMRSSDLTRQLLAFARRQTVAPQVLDLNDTIHGTLKMLRRLIGEDIDLLWKPALELDPVRIDPAQIDQLLANLVVNARDAIGAKGAKGGKGGKVTIETRQTTLDAGDCTKCTGIEPGDYVVLSVSDDGRGMDESTRAHIFEPFFTTKDVGEGTGLGLATVYGIVKQNDGFVTAESELGRGTRFTIYLPVCSVQPAASPAGAGEGVPAAPNYGTVLMVEDEPAILTMGAKMLRKLGYNVLTSSCPQDALSLAGQYEGTINLLLTDVIMPVMNGRELARRMHALYPDMKFLFISGYTADVIADQGVLGEGMHFLEKPFSIQQLAGKVRAALGRVASLP